MYLSLYTFSSQLCFVYEYSPILIFEKIIVEIRGRFELIDRTEEPTYIPFDFYIDIL